MTQITFIEHDGTEYAVDATDQQSVMQAAVDNMVPGIVADCGGACSCGTCHGYVDAQWAGQLPAPAADEAALLEGLLDTKDNSRLTCQLKVSPALEGMIVRLPASQL
ncbi:MAG: reductase [Nevskia sp.]|nr:reductase [Nevskia sp.]